VSWWRLWPWNGNWEREVKVKALKKLAETFRPYVSNVDQLREHACDVAKENAGDMDVELLCERLMAAADSDAAEAILDDLETK
jgi:hypothetical protein